ncbi:hypothetical protein ABT173_30085 [Streptomyces sp. NPDC001795]|uniref:hypothetical protein n=1 Tax=Streptomyces sp. NPDC001795 TaxID=3154525 RepID=UPI0033273E59
MGIWTDAFTAPAEPALLPCEEFGQLVVDLARERVVCTPWALLAGELCLNASLNWESVSGQARWDDPDIGTVLCSDERPEGLRDNDPPPWGDSYERARVLARGDAILDALPALRQAPYGEEDVAVVFHHLDFTNRAIVDYLQFEDERTMLVAFALARPRTGPGPRTTAGPPADRCTRCARAWYTPSNSRWRTARFRPSCPSPPGTSARIW